MEMQTEAYNKLIDTCSGVLLFALGLACAWIAERYNVPYPLFFAGWFCRSAWVKVRK